MKHVVLRVRELDPGVSTRTFELPPAWMEAQTEELEGISATDKPGSVELEVTRRGREVLLRGTVRVTLSGECVRCLEEFPYPVEADFDVLMLPGPTTPKKGRGDEDEEEDELGVERYRGDEIVLDDLIRDTIVLEVPMNLDCGDQCPGWQHLRQT